MKKRIYFLILALFVILLIPIGTQKITVKDVNIGSQSDLTLACESEPPVTYYDDKITIKLMYEEETIVLEWEDWTEDGEGEYLPDLDGLERIEFIYAWGKSGFDFKKGYTFFAPNPSGPDLVKMTYILDSEIDGESYTSHILFFEANLHDIEVDYMRWYGGEPYSSGYHSNIWLWFDEADTSVQIAFWSSFYPVDSHFINIPYEFKFQGIHGDPIFIEDVTYTSTNEYVFEFHPWGADLYSATGWLDDIELEDHLGAFFYEPYTYHAYIQINAEMWDDVVEEFDGMGTQWSPLKIKGLYFDYTSGSYGVKINFDLEDVYIDIEDCIFTELNIGVLSYPSTGRVRVKNCVFNDVKHGAYFSFHAEQIVENCLFYEISDPSGASVFLEEAYDVTLKDCSFYNALNSVWISWLFPTSHFKMFGCSIFGSSYGIKIEDSIPGEDGTILIKDNYINNCQVGIELKQGSMYSEGTQGVTVKNNEFSHCRNPIFIENEASFNKIIGNYIHDCGDDAGMLIGGHNNIIKSNRFEDSNFEIGIYCYYWSYENEFTWNVFIDCSTSSSLVADSGEGSLWDFNYYSDYEGDGKEPYNIGWPELEIQDLHPLGPEVPYIPPTPPDRTDYTYHTSITINVETWDDVIEEFDGMGTQECPLKIKGFYFEYTGYGQSTGVFINSDVEDVYIDIEDCIFIGYHCYSYCGVLSYPSSGRIRIKDCVFIDNTYGAYFSFHAEQIVKDCTFYGGSLVGGLGAGVFLEEAYDVTIKDCTFYAVEKGILAEWLSPTSSFEIDGCNIYSGVWGIDIHGSEPGEDGAIIIRNNHIDYCIRGIEIGNWQGSQYSPGSKGVIVAGNEISHCIDEAIWLQTGASYNIIKNNYIHDTSVDNWWSILIEGHHNTIVSNKFESSGIWAYGNEIFCYTNSYENEIRWNVFESLKPTLVKDVGEGNFWEYNYYSDYDGDGTEPYTISSWPGYPESQDLHPLGPELAFSFWLKLLFQYPLEVLQMLRWLI
jgi:hypothetical protein